MKKSTLLTLFIGFMFLGCSEKSITRYEPKKEKSINESLAKDLPAKV